MIRDQDFFVIFVLEAPRDQDPGLEDYITAFTIGRLPDLLLRIHSTHCMETKMARIPIEWNNADEYEYPYVTVFGTKVPVPVLMLVVCFDTGTRNELDCVFVHRYP